MKVLQGKRILLIIAGGIAAYKSLDLIRRLRERGSAVRCILTYGGSQFITPLSVAALSEDRVYQDLFSLTDEAEMGHIRLSREADLVVVAPATADLMAKMAAGLADDLASTALLATDKRVLIAPSMNVMMWQHPATRSNLETLRGRGIHVVDPGTGDLACGEEGAGRMAEPLDIVAVIEQLVGGGPLAGRRALVTSGPTHEPVDPVRFLGNRSSGRQGHAIAAALAASGADTVLVSGPTALPDPAGVRTVRVETAAEMLAASEDALPVDVAVCAAAVADWRPADMSPRKLKKDGATVPALELVENPDILATLCHHPEHRPALVIGFAAETDDVLDNARAKRERKGCDWIVANGVGPGTGTFGGERNTVSLVTATGTEPWPEMDKTEVARRLVERIVDALARRADG
jgi:phosphopantothenoylcysteine decarboxylase/phosphopantothenate--cysteine ligase